MQRIYNDCAAGLTREQSGWKIPSLRLELQQRLFVTEGYPSAIEDS